jgi:hypothetical protein
LLCGGKLFTVDGYVADLLADVALNVDDRVVTLISQLASYCMVQFYCFIILPSHVEEGVRVDLKELGEVARFYGRASGVVREKSYLPKVFTMLLIFEIIF